MNMGNNNWWFFVDLDKGSSNILPLEPFGGVPGSMAIQGAFDCITKFAGAALLWYTGSCRSNLCQETSGDMPDTSGDMHDSRPGTRRPPLLVKDIISIRQHIAGFMFGSKSKRQNAFPVVFGKIPSDIVRHLFREAERLQPVSVLSLSAAFIPPLDNLSSQVLAVEGAEIQMRGCMDQRPCSVENARCSSLAFPDFNWARDAVEPNTGIEFPMMLDYISDRVYRSSLNSEVLVGTGSRTMKIIRIKSIKVYAFGFYVHPDSVCEKLGPKYSSIPKSKLNKHNDFYKDLLREDIGMTVRLVVNCSGMKIDSVRGAFEKSLRARLVKTNPETDYHCLKEFGAHFIRDIPLPLGTTIDFRRTGDGQLITEVGGNLIGTVHSKELCRAFFDMYIGDVPVSEQAKEEIGKNVASLMRRC